jgi:hypothetical protein
VVAVTDGEFGSVDLLRELGRAMTVVTRLRLEQIAFNLDRLRD